MFLFEHSPFEASRMKIVFPSLHPLIDIYTPNARLTEQIFDGGFCACFCTKGDSGNLSGAAVCYVQDYMT